MHRVTITIDDGLLRLLEAHMGRHGFTNRSEAMRELVRDALEREQVEMGEAHEGLATLSYVYDHEARELAKRLTRSQHAHHDLTVSTLHVHLDQDRCLEVSVLKGALSEIRSLADEILAERGVRSGKLNIVPMG